MFQESLVHLEGMEYGNSELEILDACVSDKYSIYVWSGHLDESIAS